MWNKGVRLRVHTKRQRQHNVIIMIDSAWAKAIVAADEARSKINLAKGAGGRQEGKRPGAKGSRASRKRKITWPITRALDSRTAAQQAVTAAYQAVRESMEMINHRGRYPVHTHTHTHTGTALNASHAACELQTELRL